MDVEAYTLNTYGIQECHEIDYNIIIVYDNQRKGFEKRVVDKLWEKVKDWDLREDFSGRFLNKEDITFFHSPQYNKKMFKGQFISFSDYKREISRLAHQKKLDSIAQNNDVTHCHIKKHGNYYCSNFCGYTSQYHLAGVYLKADALSHAKGILELTVVEINNEKHNKTIRDIISQMENILIK